MLKATKINALRMKLADGHVAIFVECDEQWNNLHYFECVSPPSLANNFIIATPNDKGQSPFAKAFGDILNMGADEEWVAVMASQTLVARLKPV